MRVLWACWDGFPLLTLSLFLPSFSSFGGVLSSGEDEHSHIFLFPFFSYYLSSSFVLFLRFMLGLAFYGIKLMGIMYLACAWVVRRGLIQKTFVNLRASFACMVSSTKSTINKKKRKQRCIDRVQWHGGFSRRAGRHTVTDTRRQQGR